MSSCDCDCQSCVCCGNGTLVNKPAPDFKAAAVLGNGEIVENFQFSKAVSGKYAVVFFYPLDFTFVCPSELIAVHRRMNRFKELGVEVIAVSIDSQFTHNAWRNTSVADGGIGQVGYTMVADVNHRICQAFGVEHEAGVALRATFIIDKAGVVQSQIVNNLPLGRNVEEWIRLVEAIQFHEEHGDVCPAGWNKGDEGMSASPQGVADYLAKNAANL